MLRGSLLIRELVDRRSGQRLNEIFKACNQSLDRGVRRALDWLLEHASGGRATEAKVACRVDRSDRDLSQDLRETPMGFVVAHTGA